MGAPTKRQHYEYLFDRISAALDSEFYLDAAWIAHAILEDRLDAAISHSSASRASTLSRRIQSLKVAAANEPLVRGAFYNDVLTRVDDWRRLRNSMTHALGDEVKPAADLIADFKALAVTGEELAREVAAAVMRLKRRRKEYGSR